MTKEAHATERRTIALLVDNEFGVLARVIGLFAGRGYNIDSLTVSTVDEDKNLSRITIVTRGTPAVVEHIKALLAKLVPVHVVRDLTVASPHIEREVGLLKVKGTGKQRTGALALADRFGARVVDSTEESFVFELSDMPEKLDKFIHMMTPFGLIEVCRTGITAMARGSEGIDVS
ncbi:MAG: acetolactate synthase small subunit [Hyphomicrobiales bacterium]|nr:acetolactate synthase small subunit [Rickettsiales bacterium]MCP5361959.1 acetolactate synthase small subunit [Hyphomicrobiales bacterium]